MNPPRSSDVSNDPRLQLLERARPLLITRFADQDVTKIEYVAAFPHLDRISVWLCTSTDAQKQALGTDSPQLESVREALLEAGFTATQVADLVTTCQSKETVDRDFEGSWLYAMR